MEYGKYLAHTCTLCHGENLNGKMISTGGPEKYLALNLTPGGELQGWSEEDFITTLRTGVTPSRHQLLKVMPWKYFSQMTDDEMKAFVITSYSIHYTKLYEIYEGKKERPHRITCIYTGRSRRSVDDQHVDTEAFR